MNAIPVPASAHEADGKRFGQVEAADTAAQRLRALVTGEAITATISRFDPGRDDAPRYQTYQVPASPFMRVLDVLHYIAEDLEEDLAYRWSCGVKKCGTCAVRMNGREVLACWEPAERNMVIEPLRHVPVVRDLVVDRRPYDDRVISLQPWLQRSAPYGGFPERLSHREISPALSALDCLSCMACYSACPVLDLGDHVRFAGPAPLVQMAQSALDPRDGGDRGGVIAKAAINQCVSCYKCEEVCPAQIPIVTGVIEPLKRIAYRTNAAGSRHASVFMRIVKQRGLIDPTSLVVRTQGLRIFQHPIRALRLFLRGKISPARTLAGTAIKGIEQVRRLFSATRGAAS